MATEKVIEQLKRKIEFTGNFSIHTGEIKNRFRARNNSLEIVIINNKNVIIQGSLHKYYFNGDNRNDFTFHDLKSAINQLCEELDIEAKYIKVQRLEIGINVRGSPIGFDEVEDNIISYKLQPFEPYKIDGRNFGYHCRLQRFEIKIYDKGIQSGFDESILRLEYKILKMKHIEKVDIKLLSDLMNEVKMNSLIEAFIKDFSNVRMDSHTEMDVLIDEKQIPYKDAIFYLKARNPKYWIWLKKKYKSSTITSYKRRFERILKQYTTQNLTSSITHILKSKFRQLMPQ